MSDLPHMVSVALESSSSSFDAVLMVSNDRRKVRSIVEVLPSNLPLRVMTSLSRVRDALVEQDIDAHVLEEGLSSKGLSILNELYDLVLQGMGERWIAKGGRLLIVLAEPIDGVIIVDTKMLGAERLTAIAEEQGIDLDVLVRMIELSRAIGTRGREGTAIGALFAIGNIQKMRGHSTAMVLNPFKGHSETKRDVKNKENHETLAEFAWLDGAILFNREGVASDAGRYIQVPSGLTPKSGEGWTPPHDSSDFTIDRWCQHCRFLNWKHRLVCKWSRAISGSNQMSCSMASSNVNSPNATRRATSDEMVIRPSLLIRLRRCNSRSSPIFGSDASNSKTRSPGSVAIRIAETACWFRFKPLDVFRSSTNSTTKPCNNIALTRRFRCEGEPFPIRMRRCSNS